MLDYPLQQNRANRPCLIKIGKLAEQLVPLEGVRRQDSGGVAGTPMDQENMGWVPSMVKGPPVPPPSILEGVFRFLGGLRFFLGKIFKFWKNSRLLEDFFSGCFQKDFQILEDFQNSWEILRLFWETSRILGFSESCGIFRF